MCDFSLIHVHSLALVIFLVSLNHHKSDCGTQFKTFNNSNSNTDTDPRYDIFVLWQNTQRCIFPMKWFGWMSYFWFTIIWLFRLRNDEQSAPHTLLVFCFLIHIVEEEKTSGHQFCCWCWIVDDVAAVDAFDEKISWASVLMASEMLFFFWCF